MYARQQHLGIATSARTSNRYPGTACPPGELKIRGESVFRSPRFMGDKTTDDYVYCRPAPIAVAPAPPPPPPPPPAPIITVSPNIQTSITPQISPVFTQISDSAGAQVAATPVQQASGGQSGKGGGPGDEGVSESALVAMFERQAQADRERRTAESEQRESQRIRRLEAQEQLRLEYEKREAQATAQYDAERQAQAEQREADRLAVQARDAELTAAFTREQTQQFVPGPATIVPGPAADDAEPVPSVEIQEEPASGSLLLWGALVVAGATGIYFYKRNQGATA